jgi:GT2 family glycosyltransferase
MRRNEATVSITDHFNQLWDAAEGDYFVLLSDDDELSPNYVSRLVSVMSEEPSVGVALGKLEVIDERGAHVPRPGEEMSLPGLIPGNEFVRLWCRGGYRFVCFVTTMARTEEIRAVGGYPVFPKGTSVDNGMLLRLALGRQVAFVPDAVFRYRVYEASHGLALPYTELARDLKAFLQWLDSDATLGRYAAERPQEWTEVRAMLADMTWRTYRHRWKTMYRGRLSPVEWVRAAFQMPFIPAYYRSVVRQMGRRGLSAVKRGLGRGLRSAE